MAAMTYQCENIANQYVNDKNMIDNAKNNLVDYKNMIVNSKANKQKVLDTYHDKHDAY